MTDKKKDGKTPGAERTATDELVEAFRNGAEIAPVTRDPKRSEPSGLPPGMHDSHKSPVAPK